MTNRGESMPRVLAVMGGAYGNLEALQACLKDAANQQTELRAFVGDAIGCCGFSNEVVAAIRASFPVLVAGNHEQQAAAHSKSCGCGYSSAEDEAISCEAFALATNGLSDASRSWLATWPNVRIVELAGGRVLLCHGSPGQTSEFLYEMELDDLRLEAWLDHYDVRGFVCTHSGLPWIRRLRGGRFAVNCGVVGKPDHDGDPAVHYALIDLPKEGDSRLEIRRVEYDYETWARKMEGIGISPIFVEPIRTGIWTTGVASLPASERGRWLRSDRASAASPQWTPERLNTGLWTRILNRFEELGLITRAEVREAESLLDPAFPYFSAMRLADTVHLHVKVDDVDELPTAEILALGTHAENARPGYVKYSFPGGINVIFSSIPIAEEDQLPDARPPKPFVDHYGVDLRRETAIVRATFEDIPSLVRRAGWSAKAQGGGARLVYCCHSTVVEKCWAYPPAESARWTRPIEFAYGPLLIGEEMNGCDLRPIDPRHPAAATLAACAPVPAH